MTNKEKKHKILKREKYKEQISVERKNIAYGCFVMGLSALGAIATFEFGRMTMTMPAYDTDFLIASPVFLSTVSYLSSLGFSGCSVYALKNVAESIRDKTILKNNVKKIDRELTESENMRKEGKKR